MAYQHYATNPNPPPPPQFPTAATNPNPPPPPQFPTAMWSQSLQFPSTPQFSSQCQFHFPTSQSLQSVWLRAPYPGNQGQTLQSNPAVRGYVQTRRGCPPRQQTIPSHGMPRHPLLHPAVTGIQGSTVPPVLRAAFVPSITPKEERKIIVYVGSLATTVEDDFILSLLELCGPVKNWKRSEDPTTGTPNHYGFCEFESVVGVLRALRLLSKLNVDGQELKIRVTADERKYLEDFVEKLKGTEGEGAKKDEDREADQKALERLTGMIEERLKNTPVLPPPSLLPAHASGLREEPARSRDVDSDMDMTRNAEDKNDDEMTSDSKPTSEHDKPETSSTDRSRGQERSKKGGKKEKEKQLEALPVGQGSSN